MGGGVVRAKFMVNAARCLQGTMRVVMPFTFIAFARNCIVAAERRGKLLP